MLQNILMQKEYVLSFILMMNLISYFFYYLDKSRAEKHRARISEQNLLLVTFLWGGVGAWLGMRSFRHKTKKLKFKLLVPLAAGWTIISALFIFYN